MVATLHAPAGLVKKAGPGRNAIFVAVRIAERKSRKSAPVLRLLFIWVSAR